MSDRFSIEMTREEWILVSCALRRFSSEYGAEWCPGWDDEVEAAEKLEYLIDLLV